MIVKLHYTLLEEIKELSKEKKTYRGHLSTAHKKPTPFCRKRPREGELKVKPYSRQKNKNSQFAPYHPVCPPCSSKISAEFTVSELQADS